MTAKDLIDLLSELDPGAEVVLVMQPEGSLARSENGRDLDGCDCEHALACDILAEESDVILAELDGHPAWLVVRPSTSNTGGQIH
jgi:hypothetical protein